MIFSFGAKNYFSFKEGFEVSFELNSKVPKNISNGFKTSHVMGIKGANASGKTSILKVIESLVSFCTRSFQAPEGRDNLVSPFFGSKDPCEMFIEFETEGVHYIYEVSLTLKEVVSETLYKKVSRKTKVFERKLNTIVRCSPDVDQIKLVALKSNSSLIDSVNYYKFEQKNKDLSNVYNYFKSITGNVSALTVIDDKEMYSFEKVSEFYFKIPEALRFTKEVISKCDMGIKDIKMFETVNDSGEKEYFPIFTHVGDDSEPRKLTYWDQSSGTNALYRRMRAYWSILTYGGVLVMDEFDIHLHPDLLPIILNLFRNPDINRKSAQFIFTCHSLEVMDLLGKYRTILVSKVDSESYCYRLDEIPGEILRNDRLISSIYKDGKIGGVPKL